MSIYVDEMLVTEFIDNLELLIKDDEPLIKFQEEVEKFKKAIADDIESLQDLIDDEVPYDLITKELLRFKKAVRQGK